MKIKTILLFTFIGMLSGFAQNSRLNNANKKYDKYAYIDAIEIGRAHV